MYGYILSSFQLLINLFGICTGLIIANKARNDYKFKKNYDEKFILLKALNREIWYIQNTNDILLSLYKKINPLLPEDAVIKVKKELTEDLESSFKTLTQSRGDYNLYLCENDLLYKDLEKFLALGYLFYEQRTSNTLTKDSEIFKLCNDLSESLKKELKKEIAYKSGFIINIK